MLIPLKGLIGNAADPRGDSLHSMSWLSSFCCEKDRDIESFLRSRAAQFERLGKSRTYLLCDREIMQTEGRIHILGFFTVALKALDLPERLSNRKRLELDGFSAKLRGEPIKAIPCYLLGQIAKNSAAPSDISGKTLMDRAVSTIQSAAEIVGGRYILAECRDDPNLRKFYTDNGFREFDTIPDDNIHMIQLLRPIY